MVVTGTPGNDTLSSSILLGGDTFLGLAGNDTILSSYGSDLLDGGDGDDYLSGFYGNDILLGGNGNDKLEQEDGNAILDGGAGNDTLIAIGDLSKTKYFFGGLGDDKLIGASGNGPGIDTAFYTGKYSDYQITVGQISSLSRNDAIHESLIKDLRTDSVNEGHDQVTNIERLQFSNGTLAFDVLPNLPVGDAVRLVTAFLGVAGVASHPEFAGAVASLLDSGATVQQLSAAVMRMDVWGGVWGQLANGGASSASYAQIASYLHTNVYGAPPNLIPLAAAIHSLEYEANGIGELGGYIRSLTLSEANEAHVGLMGLPAQGLFLQGWLPADGSH